MTSTPTSGASLASITPVSIVLASGPGPHVRTPGTLHCYATDTSRLDELAPRFLGEPLTGFDLVDL